LVQRAEGDDRLASGVGSRPEIPLHLLFELLGKASEAVRTRLEAVHPEARGEVRRAVAEATARIRDDALGGIRGSAAALAFAEALHRAGRLDDERLRTFVQAGRFAEVAAALAVMSGLSLSFVERTMLQERADMIVVLARALDLSWSTTK